MDGLEFGNDELNELCVANQLTMPMDGLGFGNDELNELCVANQLTMPMGWK